MRAVLQRVSEASVRVDGETVGRIGRGWLVLLGVGQGDGPEDVRYLAEKTVHLRAFPDEGGRMNLPVKEVGGEVLVVSQFTLFGDCRKGRRPGFSAAASPEDAVRLYEEYCEALRQGGLSVATGRFQAHMEVALVNDGPVTFLLDSSRTL